MAHISFSFWWEKIYVIMKLCFKWNVTQTQILRRSCTLSLSLSLSLPPSLSLYSFAAARDITELRSLWRSRISFFFRLWRWLWLVSPRNCAVIISRSTTAQIRPLHLLRGWRGLFLQEQRTDQRQTWCISSSIQTPPSLGPDSVCSMSNVRDTVTSSPLYLVTSLVFVVWKSCRSALYQHRHA